MTRARTVDYAGAGLFRLVSAIALGELLGLYIGNWLS